MGKKVEKEKSYISFQAEDRQYGNAFNQTFFLTLIYKTNFDEGRVVYKPNATCFIETYLKDHLGNIRVAYGNDGNGFDIRQVDSYYPFGMTIRGLSHNLASNLPKNEYLYNGKMFQDELGLNWYDYGARFYDPVVGRWWSVDPMAEQYRKWNPYNYCVDNPMRFIDPDGMLVGDPPYWHTTSMWANKEIEPTSTAIAADIVSGPLIVGTGVVMPIDGNIIDGLNGKWEEYPELAVPVTFNSDFSFNFRSEMMHEVSWEDGKELLGATAGWAIPTPKSDLITKTGSFIVSELTSKLIENIPPNEKNTKTDKPINEQKNTDNSTKKSNGEQQHQQTKWHYAVFNKNLPSER